MYDIFRQDPYNVRTQNQLVLSHWTTSFTWAYTCRQTYSRHEAAHCRLVEKKDFFLRTSRVNFQILVKGTNSPYRYRTRLISRVPFLSITRKGFQDIFFLVIVTWYLNCVLHIWVGTCLTFLGNYSTGHSLHYCLNCFVNHTCLLWIFRIYALHYISQTWMNVVAIPVRMVEHVVTITM